MSSQFLNIFAKSPFKAIQSHMTQVHRCASLLKPFFAEAMNENWPQAEALRKKIVDAEEEADQLKKYIRLNLPNNLFLPVSRSDLLQLVTEQDCIANTTKDVSGLIVGRKMVIPQVLRQNFENYIESAYMALDQAKKAIDELDELLETGFKGLEAKLVEAMIVELDALEGKADIHEINLRAAVQAIETHLAPIDAIFLYKVIDWIGHLADDAQHVGHRLQLLLAK